MKVDHLLHLLVLTLIPFGLFGKNLPDTLEQDVQNVHNKQELKELIDLAGNYVSQNSDLAIALSEKLKDKAGELDGISIARIQLNQALAYFHKRQPDTSKYYAKKAYRIFKANKDSLGISNTLRTFGNIAYLNTKHDSAMACFKKVLKMKKAIDDHKGNVVVYNNMGYIHEEKGQFLKALKYYNKALYLADSINAPKAKALPLSNITNTYQKIGDYEDAITYSFEVLNLTQKYNLESHYTFAYNAIGSAYKAIKDYGKAMEFFAKSLNAAKERQDTRAQAEAYNNIGDVLLKQGNTHRATTYFKKALNFYNTLTHNKGRARSFTHLANAYLQLGLTNRALLFINRAIDLNTSNQNKYSLAGNFLVKGQIMMRANRLKKANELLSKSVQMKKELHILNKKDVLRALAKIHKKTGNFREASSYLDQYITNEREVEDARKSRRIERLKIENELREHIREKKDLRKEARLQQEKLKRQQLIKNVMIGGIAFLVVFILAILRFYYLRSKSYKQLKERNAQIKLQAKKLNAADAELKKFRFVLDNADNAVIITTPGGKIQWINKAITKIYGFTEEEFKDKAGADIKIKSGREDITNILEEVNRTGKTQNYEAVNYSKNKEPIYTHTTLTPIKNAKGVITNLVFIDSDITQQKAIQKKLKETIKTRDKFLSIIAHDLRNPFNSISGFANLIIKRFGSLNCEKQLTYVKNIRLAANQGYELLQNLLHWAKSQSGDITYSPQSIPLKELATNTMNSIQFRAEEKQIRLVNNLSSDYEVWADYNMADTILRNLLSNAIKFTPAEGEVRVSAFKQAQEIRIEVEDTGLGMDEDTVNKIFKDINFTTKGTDNENGTGLGLVLCKEFAEKNNGKIWVSSSPGKGSIFAFTLPLAENMQKPVENTES